MSGWLPACSLACLFLLCWPLNSAWSSEETVKGISTAVRKIFDESRGAVVQIESRDERGTLRCTGFYVDPIGTIYTLASVAEDMDTVEVLRDGQRFPAEVLVSDPRSGMAILRSEPGGAFLLPCSTNQIDVAEPLVLVGYPLDLDISPGFGLISGFDRKIGTAYFSTTHIRVNVPVLRGQGGAPLLNMEGRVVGMVTASVDGGATCHALPIAAAKKIYRDWARHGEVRHGWVGVDVDNAPESQAGSRAVVRHVDALAPAGLAGVQPGDTILRVGATSVNCREDILDASFFLSAGETTSIEVLREGKPLVLEAETILHPNARKPALQAGMELNPLLSPVSVP